MNKLRNYFIGDYLALTDNVFTRSKIRLLYNFTSFYLINVIFFWSNTLSKHYYYHAGILGFSIVFLTTILFVLRKSKNYELASKLLLLNQTIVGIVSYLIQESTMDFVGEFFILVNILIAFFTLGTKYGFIVTGFWLLQIGHCLANDLSGGKFVLIHIPKDQVLPPTPVFVLVPFFLCVYIIYEFVKTRAEAERDIQLQKQLLENKNKEITNSITYARRIQQSLLPTEKYIDKNLDRLQKNKH
jgi:hypothetical protein